MRSLARAIHSALDIVGRVARPLTLAVVLAALVGRARAALHRHGSSRLAANRASRATLPSLYDEYPEATSSPRRALGLRTVPVEEIVGTLRRPSQNTADFMPLPELRGRNWAGRWQRILRAVDNLEVLPPVELMKIGPDRYYVADGHNRVAAARRAGAIAVDADVTELLIPGIDTAHPSSSVSGSILGSLELRDAVAGRHPRAAPHRSAADRVTRRDLLRAPDEDPTP